MKTPPSPVLLLLLTGLLQAAEPEVDPAGLHPFPALAPDEAQRRFELAPGFRIELAAAEPEVVDPVAMAFDARGALYVVEMRDYSERRAEKLSRVRRLTDRDGDGRFETATVFLDGLAWATGVACFEDSVIVITSPDVIVARDADGDGRADERRVVVTGFGEGRPRLNVQALPNSLTWGPDGRLHGATAGNGGRLRRVVEGVPVGEAVDVNGADFSLGAGSWDVRAESGTAQFGLTFDALGRKFVCSNSHHIQWVRHRRSDVPATSLHALPVALVDIPADGPAAPVFRTSPEEPWRVVRTNWRASGLVPGLVEGGGRASGYFTSACGIHVAKGRTAPGDAFIADVGSNLVHRKRLRETDAGPVAERVPGEETREFLTSSDPWFRPVAFADAPDGSLLVADLYREVVEHPDSLPPALKRHLDLSLGNDRGRIWRIVAEKPAEAPVPTWPRLADAAAVQAALASDEPARQMAGLRALRDLKEATPSGALPSLLARAGAPVRHEAALVVAAGDFPQRVEWLARLHQRGVPLETVLPGLRTADEERAFAAAVAPATDAGKLALFSRLTLTPEDAVLALARHSLDGPAAAEALALLVRADASFAEKVALDSARPTDLRREALRRWAAAGSLPLGAWKGMPSALRSEAMDRILTAKDGPARVAAALEANELPPEALGAAQVATLRASRDPAVRRAATAVFGPPVDRSALVERYQTALSQKGDAPRGRELFLQRCATCHRDGTDGAAVGPDRVTFTNKGKPTLLVAIIDPHREVAPQFCLTTVTTRDGRTLAGIVVRVDPTGVVLRQPGGVEMAVRKDEVATLSPTARSLMPEGLEAGLEPAAMADLLEFLVR